MGISTSKSYYSPTTSTTFPVQVTWRILHHPAKPLYPIISPQSFSNFATTHFKFSKPAISHTATQLWNDPPSEYRRFSVYPSSFPLTDHHPPQAPLPITRRNIHSNVKCHLLENSYSDSPFNSSRAERHPP